MNGERITGNFEEDGAIPKDSHLLTKRYTDTDRHGESHFVGSSFIICVETLSLFLLQGKKMRKDEKKRKKEKEREKEDGRLR